MRTTSLECPTCQSDDTKRLSLIHEMGVLEIHAVAGGVGVSGGGLGTGGAATSGTSRTLLAEKAAPPERISLAWWAVACGIVFFTVVGTLPGWLAAPAGIVMLAGSVWLLRRFHDTNQKEHPEKLRKWKQTFMCLRCGHLFEPGK